MDEFLEKALAYSLRFYRNDAHGMLVVELPKLKGKHEHHLSPVALITEHRPFESRQRTLGFDGNAEAAALLPVGEYTVVVSAKGYEPFRAVAAVTAGGTSTVKAKLVERKREGTTFEEILKKNLVQRDARSFRSLTVGAGQTLVLDPKSPDLSMDLNYIELRNLKEVKQVLGVPDSVSVGETPRFGRFAPPRPYPDAPVKEGLTLAQRAALQEYVYGNSKSVSDWHSSLNSWIVSEVINWLIWAFWDIDVGPHAVLEVSWGGLLCNTLRVHYTGLVRVKGPGPVKIEMNHYERYGFTKYPYVTTVGLPPQ